MVFPIAAAIAGGSSLISSILGALDNTEERIAAMNMIEQQKQRSMMQWLANQQIRMSTASRTDARGNVARYDPATNSWELQLTPTTQSIINAWDAEELKRGTQDQYDARAERQLNLQRRLKEGDMADSYMEQLGRPSPYDQGAIEDAIFNKQTQGVNEGFDRGQNQVMRNVLRGGVDQGAVGDILSAIMKERGEALGGAKADAYLKSLESERGLNSSRSADLSGLYNLFGSRSSNIYDAPFSPSNIEATGESSLNTGASLVPQSLGLAGSLMSRIQPQMAQYQGGLTRAGLGIGSIGDAFSGLFDLGQSDQIDPTNRWLNDNDILNARGSGNIYTP